MLILAAPSLLAAPLRVVPNTTLTAETSNNTSASSSFAGLPNGDLSPTNISKVNVHTLLNTGSDVKVYAHTVGWWGGTSHPNVGYSSTDPAHVKAEIDDMQSRGIDGLVLDWYGYRSSEEKTLQALTAELANRPGFEFVVMIDAGALKWSNTPCFAAGTCTATEAVEQQITYLRSKYFSNPNIAHRGNKILLMEFGMETYNPDWQAIQTANPDVAFLHRNNGGFSKAASAGGYSWVAPVTTNYTTYEGLAYLTSFYNTATLHPNEIAFGSTFRAFDDSIASWAPPGGRHIASLCGKTWLDTWAQARTATLDSVQLVTWDDYEEGTELETGVDNCAALKATLTGTSLSVALTGDPSTIHHYTLFVSTDGQNLMTLADNLSDPNVDLSSFNLAPGDYLAFVKAVGQPMVFNHMSNSVAFNIPNQPPTASLTLSTIAGVAPLQISASVSAADVDGTVASIVLDFGDGTLVNSGTSIHTYAVPGTYTVTATVRDDLGATTTATQTVVVSSPVLPKPIVTILTPSNGATVGSPINLSVKASSANGAITCFAIYVNSQLDEKVCGTSAFAKGVAVPHGKSNVTVNAWDVKGQVGKATITVNRP